MNKKHNCTLRDMKTYRVGGALIAVLIMLVPCASQALGFGRLLENKNIGNIVNTVGQFINANSSQNREPQQQTSTIDSQAQVNVRGQVEQEARKLLAQPYIDPLTDYTHQHASDPTRQQVIRVLKREIGHRCQAKLRIFASKQPSMELAKKFSRGYGKSCPGEVAAFESATRTAMSKLAKPVPQQVFEQTQTNRSQLSLALSERSQLSLALSEKGDWYPVK